MNGGDGVGDKGVRCGQCPAACSLANCQSSTTTACYDVSGAGGAGSGGTYSLLYKFTWNSIDLHYTLLIRLLRTLGKNK